MEDSPGRFSSSYNGHSEYPRALTLKSQSSTSSGLRLVLPPLKSVLAAKAQKKTKRSGSTSYAESPIVQDVEIIDKRPPRPVKLKPLKEVLSKLIHQIKKKDDYAFFLTPVDAKNVPGYLDVVKTPMDFGTISEKVNRGRYRSLDDFANDFKLVTTNAKIFNPPGTIYHHEAERIEAWGLDHISKAAGTVIQYEADWNIDIEREDDAPTVNIEDDEEEPRSTPMDVEDQPPVRSGSVVSQQPTMGRRGPRGPYRKQTQVGSNTLAECMEADGRLPGSKDGIGAFPPGSDWANTMLSLKLKGKRYKTKKERLRIEREGPPTLVDGSLDYTEMEDPFSILSPLVPDPPSRPGLIPLYAPLSAVPSTSHADDFNRSTSILRDQGRQSVPPYGDPQSRTEGSQQQPSFPLFPSATSVPLGHSSTDFSFYEPLTSSQPSNRRHWNISRAVNTRQKGKDRDEEDGQDCPYWQQPREPHPTDFGSFSLLAGELAEEMRRRGLAPGMVQPTQEQQIHFDFIRDSLAINPPPTEIQETKKVVDASGPREQEEIVQNYWTKERLVEGESYLQDLVYGGETGMAYVRSLAEFMQYIPEPESEDEEMLGEEDDKCLPAESSLGMPVTTWVERNVVDPLTEGRHSLLREVASIIYTRSGASSNTSIAQQVMKSLNLYPVANAALAALISITMHKIDMGALIKTPGELFVSEEEWYGKELKEKRKPRASTKLNGDNQHSDDFMEVEEPPQTWVGADVNDHQQGADGELEGPEELKEVLDYSAAVILDLNRRTQASADSQTGAKNPQPLPSDSGHNLNQTSLNGSGVEDPVLRNLRLNLLALAKRAPLDTIARLPKDLVPEHIRQYVPTLGSST